MTTAADIDTDREAMRLALAAVEEARRALLARLGGGEVEVAVEGDAWPPNPATIDLNDGTWWSTSEAVYALRCSEDTALRRAKTEPIAIQVGVRWWFKRERALRNLRNLRS